MPSIGELFVTLGAKVDGSVERGLRQLQQLGITAKMSAQQMNAAARSSQGAWSVLSREVNSLTSAFNNVGTSARSAVGQINAVSNAAARAARSNLEAVRAANLAARSGKSSGISWGGVGDPFNTGGQKSAMREAAENAKLRAMAAVRTPGNSAMDALRMHLGGGVDGDTGPGMFNLNGRRSVSWANFRAGAPTPVGPERYFPSFGGVPPGRTPGGRPGGGGGGGGRSGGGGFGSGRFGPIGELSMFRRVILGAGIYQGIQEMAQLSDSYNNILTRLRQVTHGQDELNSTYERLHGIANKSQADLGGVSEAYVRIKQSTDRMGLSAQDTFKVVDRITEAFALSGASTAEAKGAMTQLTQAFNSNKLAGDEFRTMTEQMPSILKMLAVTMKVPEDRLKQMAKEGKITRKVIVDTLLAANHLDTDINNRAKTFSGTWTNFKNNIMKSVGEAFGNPEVMEAFNEVLGTLATILVYILKILPPILKGIGSFIKGLKDGKPWAIALAAVLGMMLLPQIVALVVWFGRLFALPFTGFLSNMAKMKAMASGNFGASLGGMAGPGGAVGGGGVGGVGAAAGVGVIPVVGQSIAAGLMLREGAKYAAKNMGLDEKTNGWFSTLTGIGGPGLSDYGGAVMTPDEILRFKAGGKVGPGDLSGAARGGVSPNVNIGPTNVTIYAKDGKDAADQFTEELMNRRNREASAVFNRDGS